jgi:hypothetical protein
MGGKGYGGGAFYRGGCGVSACGPKARGEVGGSWVSLSSLGRSGGKKEGERGVGPAGPRRKKRKGEVERESGQGQEGTRERERERRRFGLAQKGKEGGRKNKQANSFEFKFEI